MSEEQLVDVMRRLTDLHAEHHVAAATDEHRDERALDRERAPQDGVVHGRQRARPENRSGWYAP
ncbi:MAG: hypothetical protein JO246_16390 [Frankiaceae bacterium]|nr:hypothetical protein [Frankiaceae bacterium]MBV9871624.1 hypothetical protein [Frankiaceae bacterium]